MENSGLYIFNWWQIALFCTFLGFYFGWNASRLFIFFKVTKDYFDKKLAKKTNVVYLNKYKKQR